MVDLDQMIKIELNYLNMLRRVTLKHVLASMSMISFELPSPSSLRAVLVQDNHSLIHCVFHKIVLETCCGFYFNDEF